MADYLFDQAREEFLGGDLDWDAHNIIALLVTADWTPSQGTGQYISDIDVGSPSPIVARSGNLGSKTKTAGVADAADVTISAVTGAQVTQIALCRDTGDDATSRVIAHIDSYSGLPFTPAGEDVQIQWPNDSNRIFKL